MPKRIDITGKVYGKLTAIECVGRNEKGFELWKCKCECGEETIKQKHNLTMGKTKSCGCLHHAIKDLTGKVFGRLTVIAYEKHDPVSNISMWRCKCECGEETVLRTNALTLGRTKSCGCLKWERDREREDITGQVFGRLTALEFVGPHPDYPNNSMWKCKCECGEEFITRIAHLKSGASQSCGCLNREKTSTINFKHGLYQHHLYHTWALMRNRCNNPNSDSYKNYGGRGIKVCDEWNESFEAFHRDMAHTHKEGLTLERKDVNGNYSPENCVWATQEEQQNNKRNTRYITVFGEKMSVSQAAKKYNIHRNTLDHRLNVLKLSPDDAVTLPVRKGKRK